MGSKVGYGGSWFNTEQGTWSVFTRNTTKSELGMNYNDVHFTERKDSEKIRQLINSQTTAAQKHAD